MEFAAVVDTLIVFFGVDFVLFETWLLLTTGFEKVMGGVR